MSIQNRKQDAHRKIQMGGLIIKAGLDKLHDRDKVVLLGALKFTKQKLHGPKKEQYYKYFKQLGDQTFNDQSFNKQDGGYHND